MVLVGDDDYKPSYFKKQHVDLWKVQPAYLNLIILLDSFELQRSDCTFWTSYGVKR